MIVVPGGPGEGTLQAFFFPLAFLLGQAALPVHPGDGGVGGGVGISVSHGAFLLFVRPGDFFFLHEGLESKKKEA